MNGDNALAAWPSGTEFDLSRRSFSKLAVGALTLSSARAQAHPLKALAVVAHPDDEYNFAVTAYRMVRELGGVVDELVITNGEGGFSYSTFAEAIYGMPLTDERVGRAELPEIRKRETVAAGRIIGIRHHYFLNEEDAGYTLDPAETLSAWDQKAIRNELAQRLAAESYDFVFTLLPNVETHGHHKAATVLAAEAVAGLPPDRRPAVLAVEAVSSGEPARDFTALENYPLTRVGPDVYEVLRSEPLGFRDALTYGIVANWVIAEHKSQGLFQMDFGRHDVERFRRVEVGGPRSIEATERLFDQLSARSLHTRR